MSKRSWRGKSVDDAAQPDRDVAQRPVVHVEHPRPGDPADIDAQAVAVVDVVVQECGQEVVRQPDGSEVAGEVQVDVLHRDYLRKTAAGGTALHAEHGAHGRFAQTDHRPLADPREGVTQADRGRGLAFARRCRADRRHQDQACVFPGRQGGDPVGRHLRLVAAIGLQRRCRDSGPLGNLGDRLHAGRLSDFDVGIHQRGRSLAPIRNSSTARAAWRPSRIAHTTSDCPRRMSPAAKIFSRLVR